MEARRRHDGKPHLGEILLERGLITKEQLNQALRVQAGGLRRLGYLLVKMKFISDVQLREALATQLSIPIVDVEREFRPEVRALLPRYICHRFAVLPLAFEENNVLRLAMADPLDDVAIREVENYTGRAVQPVLAGVREIQGAVGRRVAFSRRDLFNPEVYRRVANVSMAAAFVLLLAAGYLTYNRMIVIRYGTEKQVGTSMIYQNHDLRVDVGADGSIFFSGRGAFAEGNYGVRFESVDSLNAFVKSQSRLLSGDQQWWLEWLVRNKLTHG